MARKKEPHLLEINKKRIAEVAKQLFMTNGIENTRIDDIAKMAEMSKSTLYVYFRSKEEIRNYISLEAMEYFYEHMKTIFAGQINSPEEMFISVCNFFVDFKRAYPVNFQMLTEEISIDNEIMANSPYLKEIYDTGEKINQLFFDYLRKTFSDSGAEEMDDAKIYVTVMTLWGSICGVIQLAENKAEYIKKTIAVDKNEFMQQSFLKLFRMIKEG